MVKDTIIIIIMPLALFLFVVVLHYIKLSSLIMAPRHFLTFPQKTKERMLASIGQSLMKSRREKEAGSLCLHPVVALQDQSLEQFV